MLKKVVAASCCNNNKSWTKVKCSVKQEPEGPLTDLTGRHVHTSSQQVSQGAVFCHLLLTNRIGIKQNAQT